MAIQVASLHNLASVRLLLSISPPHVSNSLHSIHLSQIEQRFFRFLVYTSFTSGVSSRVIVGIVEV